MNICVYLYYVKIKKRMIMKIFRICIAVAMLLMPWEQMNACTGITLTAKDSARIVARTIEWGGSELNSQYVIVPRGYTQHSYVPGYTLDGMKLVAKYGYVGLAVEQKEFVVEGLNEVGLSAGLFYFPGYGKYEAYDESRKQQCVTDFQLVSWILGTCATVDEVKRTVPQALIVAIDPRASTVHWRFADASGNQIVLEIVDGKPCFYENKLGVLTNSPGFEWQMTNLNNYVNLLAGTAQPRQWGATTLASFGAGSAFLGLPGDVTPPSRFVRAAFYQTTAPLAAKAEDAVRQGFQILNNFDIPVGVEFADKKIPADIPSATQWTTVTDMTNRIIYYRTMYNSAIRCIDLSQIDFASASYFVAPLDKVKAQPFVPVEIPK